jgi:hypothetical protein
MVAAASVKVAIVVEGIATEATVKAEMVEEGTIVAGADARCDCLLPTQTDCARSAARGRVGDPVPRAPTDADCGDYPPTSCSHLRPCRLNISGRIAGENGFDMTLGSKPASGCKGLQLRQS